MVPDLTLRDNGVPIYVQLRQQIAAAIGQGLLVPGMRLPTTRQVAVALNIDLNTVQRAYADLEREGMLTAVRGSGAFVAKAPPGHGNERTRLLAGQVAAQARTQGVDLAALARALLDIAGQGS